MPMQISAVQQFSLLDFPEKTSCIVFTPGCNFRCGYCHNPEFVLPEELKKLKGSFIDEASFFRFLDGRIGLLDGVVITGGEPTIQHDLSQFIEKVKARGFLVKLDTNGSHPMLLDQLIRNGMLDYVAMDVKSSLAGYPSLVGNRVSPEKIKESIDILKQGNVPYEFRSTLIKECHPEAVLTDMANLLAGADTLYLQSFRSGITLDSSYAQYHPFSSQEMKDIQTLFLHSIGNVHIR